MPHKVQDLSVIAAAAPRRYVVDAFPFPETSPCPVRVPSPRSKTEAGKIGSRISYGKNARGIHAANCVQVMRSKYWLFVFCVA